MGFSSVPQQEANMNRKDCEIKNTFNRRNPSTPSSHPFYVVILSIVVLILTNTESQAGSVRVWPTAVVVGDSIRLDDLCELKGFDSETEKIIAALSITTSPPPGGSRIVHLEMIRATLATNHINMATVSLKGATNCEVSRPGLIQPAVNQVAPSKNTQSKSGSSKKSKNPQHRQSTGSMKNIPSKIEASDTGVTLRQAVVDFFNHELKRYHGRAEVIFDRTSEQVLDLSGPQYTFHVRRRQNHPLGLIPLEVDVLSDARTVQTVPLVVQVTMIRPGLVARRAINQGATIQQTDIDVISLTFTKIDKLGMINPAYAIGQRAKKFQAAGSIIQESDIESVPLVVRGQLVTLTSIAGSVRIVTTAKATADGLLGELVTVRAADNKRVEFDAVVTGPGKVQIGHGEAQPAPTIRVAGGQ